MNKLAIVAAAALTAGTFGMAAAIAQDVGGDFDKFDGNKDKVISFEEAFGAYPTLTQIVFDQADANKDGTLDEGEFTALQGLTAGDNDDSGTSSSEASSSDASSSEASSDASSSDASSSSPGSQ